MHYANGLSNNDMVHWRFKNKEDKQWYFGFVTIVGDLIRMGRWYGDRAKGVLVSIEDIEYKPYSR